MNKYILKSIFSIGRYIFTQKKVNVVFYYPQHFNRSSEGENPYFITLIEACREKGISYLLIEEPDSKTSAPRNSEALPFDALFWAIISIRKILRILFKLNYIQQEKLTAKIINILTFGKFKVNKYITISGSMEHLFAAINKKGNVFDLQHGIIYSTHWGYFNTDGSLIAQHRISNLNFMVYGDEFKSCFYRNPNNESLLKDRIHVIGYPFAIATDIGTVFNGKSILFSLQYTQDDTAIVQTEYSRILDCVLYNLPKEQVLIYKHHPRYNNSYDLSYIFDKHVNLQIKETSESIVTLKNKIMLHITFASTTAFEYAAYGIPTYFLYSDIMPQGKIIFYDEYKYPLYYGLGIKEVIERLSDPSKAAEDAKAVKEWYDKFYSPFDKRKFIEIIKS